MVHEIANGACDRRESFVSMTVVSSFNCYCMSRVLIVTFSFSINKQTQIPIPKMKMKTVEIMIIVHEKSKIKIQKISDTEKKADI